MERVLIVAKTRMNNGVCVSGLTRTTSRGIRLIPPDRINQPDNTKFDVGQVWDIAFQDAPQIKPPHVEDVIISDQKYVRDVPNIREILLERIQPWKGEPQTLFDGLLTFGETNCYISETGNIPDCSTGYWMPSVNLFLDELYEKPRYRVPYIVKEGSALRRHTIFIPYVGCKEPLRYISPDTLLRVSLARWWKPKTTNCELRCYLQLSGWYL